MGQPRNKRTDFRVEQLEGRSTPSGGAGAATAAAAVAVGTATDELVQSGFNIGQDLCSQEAHPAVTGDGCAAENIELLNPPGGPTLGQH